MMPSPSSAGLHAATIRPPSSTRKSRTRPRGKTPPPPLRARLTSSPAVGAKAQGSDVRPRSASRIGQSCRAAANDRYAIRHLPKAVRSSRTCRAQNARRPPARRVRAQSAGPALRNARARRRVRRERAAHDSVRHAVRDLVGAQGEPCSKRRSVRRSCQSIAARRAGTARSRAALRIVAGVDRRPRDDSEPTVFDLAPRRRRWTRPPLVGRHRGSRHPIFSVGRGSCISRWHAPTLRPSTPAARRRCRRRTSRARSPLANT